MSILDLQGWLQTPQGRYLLAWEQDGVDRTVADIFGYNAAQIGLPEIDLLRANRMPHRFGCAPAAGAQVQANEFELPFATASLDLVLLPHVLEFSRHPHEVLREVERVLVAEGSVVITGFNPISLWGLRRVLGCRATAVPWNGQYRSAMRIRDWLNLLGFEIRGSDCGCFVPPVHRAQWLERWRFMDRAGARWWPVLGAAYLLHGVKRVHGMRLITPRWRGRKAHSKRLSPLAQRNGDTRKTH
ncbi:class I SAM-dependent methyltransferase [Thauera aromatica]|uniref:class I SAM-dependent methyltransferase n=1 Tax=Thauera aromatica TaxID=59405 RepID=UPI001FFCB7A2|nr:methyltransferase domain-containing protein [Thauera aromatica]MCK2096671.1 class I SAM-dependent methyltransferase [Thauera aromatica]